MAEPISFNGTPRASSMTNLEQLQNAPIHHAEAVLSGYELLQLLHDRGVLNLLRGLLGAGGDFINTISAAIDTPESIRAIRNFLLLTKFFASIPPNVLGSLVETVKDGARWERSHKAPSLLRLIWRLRNKNSRHAASIALDLLEGLGKGLK